jgi:ABC-type amino acid transport substrate-binding protein
MRTKFSVNKGTKMKKIASWLLAALFVAGCATVGAPGAGGTLGKIRQGGGIALGYREAAVPFSYVGENKQPAGYSIELCKRVVEGLKQQLGLASLATTWVPVTAENRFERVKSGQVDLECGITTMSLSRQAEFDFSLMTVVDGASILVRADAGNKTLEQMGTARIGVNKGTTTEAIVRAALKDRQAKAELVPVAGHAEGLAQLRDGKILAYAADRTVLIGMALSTPGTAFVVADEMFSYEPYGLMMRRDPDFRLAVNKALAQTYRSGEIIGIYRNSLGTLGEPSALLKAMFALQALPE